MRYNPPDIELLRRVQPEQSRTSDMNAIHRVDRSDQVLRTLFRIVDHRPELGLLRVQLGEFAPMMS